VQANAPKRGTASKINREDWAVVYKNRMHRYASAHESLLLYPTQFWGIGVHNGHRLMVTRFKGGPHKWACRCCRLQGRSVAEHRKNHRRFIPNDLRTSNRFSRTHLKGRYIDYTDGKKGVYVQSIAFENRVFGLPLGGMVMGSVDLATQSWNRRDIEIPFLVWGLLVDFASWMPALSQVIDKSYISFIRPLEVPNYPEWLRNHLKITLNIQEGYQQTGQVLYYVR
jgi:hypothetical protein